MENTGRYALPLIMPQQAQKHVTHNEALTLVDGLIFPVIAGFGSNVAPTNPVPGKAWYTGPNPTGDWFDQPLRLAIFTSAGWRFVVPQKGLTAFDETSGQMILFDGSNWASLSTAINFNNLPMVGVNTGADTVNRLAVRAKAALMSAVYAADGGDGDFQIKLNKEAAADTGSLLFQTNWSGRAEMGLAGDDDFRIKVSADGSAWTSAISISRTTGLVTLTPRSVNNTALANIANGRIKGRVSANTGGVEDLTGVQVASLLPTFSIGVNGLVPAALSGNGGFLRADSTWSEPGSNPDRFYSFNDCVSATSSQDWTFTVAGTGAAHSLTAFGTSNSLGAVQAALGTTATGRCAIACGAYTYFALGQGESRFKSRLKISTLSDTTNSWSLRAGFLDSITTESTDGVFFRYSHSFAAGNFQAVCRTNNVETAIDTSVTASAGTAYVLDVFINADATAAEFRINGNVVATVSTNIPAGSGRELGYGLASMRSAGTAAINAYIVDYLMTDLRFNTSRQ